MENKSETAEDVASIECNIKTLLELLRDGVEVENNLSKLNQQYLQYIEGMPLNDGCTSIEDISIELNVHEDLFQIIYSHDADAEEHQNILSRCYSILTNLYHKASDLNNSKIINKILNTEIVSVTEDIIQNCSYLDLVLQCIDFISAVVDTHGDIIMIDRIINGPLFERIHMIFPLIDDSRKSVVIQLYSRVHIEDSKYVELHRFQQMAQQILALDFDSANLNLFHVADFLEILTDSIGRHFNNMLTYTSHMAYTHRIVAMLQHHDPNITGKFLQIVSGMLRSNYEYLTTLKSNLLPVLAGLLYHPSVNVVKETLSVILKMARTNKTIYLYDCGFWPAIVHYLGCEDGSLVKHSLKIIRDIADGSSECIIDLGLELNLQISHKLIRMVEMYLEKKNPFIEYHLLKNSLLTILRLVFYLKKQLKSVENESAMLEACLSMYANDRMKGCLSDLSQLDLNKFIVYVDVKKLMELLDGGELDDPIDAYLI